MLDQAQSQSQRFEPTQGAMRLGLLVDLVLQGSRKAAVKRDDVEIEGMHPIRSPEK